MKYYKNLIKRKRYGVIIASILVALLGLFVTYKSIAQVISEGIKMTGLSPNMVISSGIAGLIGKTNIGMMLMGLFVTYIGIVYIPVNSPASQEPSDYTVKSVNDENIYIKFKDNEYLIKKETFAPTDLFFKDKNGKFVSVTRGYQIYNYVKSNYSSLLEKPINKDKIIKNDEIISKFQNIKLMSDEDKKIYINHKQLKNKKKTSSFCASIFFVGMSLYMLLGTILILISEMQIQMPALVLSIIFLLIGKTLYKDSIKDKELINKIMNGKMYIADCYSYDKKVRKHSEGEDYFIKVTDNNGNFIDKWFEIQKDVYTKNETVKAKLIILEEAKEEIFEVISY